MPRKTKAWRVNDMERLVPVLASIHEAVIIAQTDGTVLMANPATEVITGSPPHELIGRVLGEALTFKCANVPEEHFFREALTGWRAVELSQGCELVRSSGRNIPVAATATPLYTEGGDYAGVVLVLRDLTEEVQRRRRQYEFLSFVSHQFRQPLGNLRWGLELVLANEKNLQLSNRELLNDLHGIAVRFKDFINELLDVSRLEEGRLELKRDKVEIRGLLEGVLALNKGLALSHNVTVELFPEGEPREAFLVVGDKDRLADVFINLLTNAILYNRPQGKVTVVARRARPETILALVQKIKRRGDIAEYLTRAVAANPKGQQFVFVTVSDTGLGIPDSDQPNVFEFFFRAKNVVAKGISGSGVGLFIVKAIVERSGGRIFFASKENEGTTFYIVLPSEETEPQA